MMSSSIVSLCVIERHIRILMIFIHLADFLLKVQIQVCVPRPFPSLAVGKGSAAAD